MRRVSILIALLLVFGLVHGVTTLFVGDVFTQYDTKQAFVASTTDYAVSEVFDGNALAGKYCTVTVVTPDSTVNSAATAAKYLVATLQGSNSQAANWVEIGTARLWEQLCAVSATATAATNKGYSSSFILDLTKFNMPYLRFKYDVYAAGTRLTDVTTAGSVKTIISTGNK